MVHKMQVGEGAAHAHCIRRCCNQTLPGTFCQEPETRMQPGPPMVTAPSQSDSPLMNITLTEWQKNPLLLKLQVVLSIQSELICILSFAWVKGQRKKSATLTIPEECGKFSWMVISILLLYSDHTVFSHQLLSISDSAGIDLRV